MLLSSILTALATPAHAYPVEPCPPATFVGLPYGIHSVEVPPDGAIPVLLFSECGASGTVDVRLHRSVDGIAAEEVLSETIDLAMDQQAFVLLDPAERLFEDTDYLVVATSDESVDQQAFTTGSQDAIGMAAGAPELTVLDILAIEQDNGKQAHWVDVSISSLADADGLSYLEVYSSQDPSTPRAVYLAGTRAALSNSLFIPDSDPGEACFFAVQVDGLGTVSEPSAEACATPRVEPRAKGCSSAAAAPGLASALIALLLGLGRRRR